MAYARGDTILRNIRKLTCENTMKIPLKFDPLGRLISDNLTTFQSYISYLVKDRISIAYPDWKAVPKHTKNGVYDAVMNTFIIPPEKMSKKKVLNNMNSKWKTLKTNIGKLMEDPKTGKALDQPPKRCQFIDQDTWNEFVKYRSTDEFRKRSEANRECSKKKKYPYKASRKGYARLGEEMLIAQGKDPETNIISKVDSWLAARSDGHGNYGDPETRRIANKIDMLPEKQFKGLITPIGREDILSLSLEKDEDPGRLRGLGFGVGVKEYYGSTRRTCSSSQQEVIALKTQMAEMQRKIESLEKYYKHMESQGSSLKPQVPPPKCPEEQEVQSPVVERGCSRINSPHMDPSELTEKTKRCNLVWPDQSCEVARGRGFIPVAGQPTILHSKQLGENILKVSIDTIAEENGKVPFPTEEVPYLSDNALGNIVAWPKDKVIFEPGVVPSSKRAKKALFKPKVQDKFQPKPQYPAMDKCKSLMATVDDFVLKIDIPKAVVQHSHKLEIRKDDLVSWLARGELDGVHISMYIKYLYDKYEPSLCKFLCPSRVAYVARSSDDLTLDYRVRYMASSLREPSGCLWLVPYHEGYHWMLVVINSTLNTIYWLDPLRHDVRANFQEMCEALRTEISQM